MPEPITYCKTCLMPTSRPGMVLNDDGVCSACLWHEKKKTIDWDGREQQFQEIADWAKKTTKAPWDCVLGVSGGKDSLWQAHQLRDRFGLNPLLVMYVASDITDLGRKNAENMVRCGFTVLSIQPNPQIARALAKKSFFEFGNIAKFSELALFSAPFRTAIDYNIPLVLFGENPALEAGDVNTENPGWDASGVRFSNTLSGAAVDIWLGDGVEKKDLIQYHFPSLEELESWGGRGVFMGYFLNWSGWENAVFSIAHGMSTHAGDYEDIGIHHKHHSIDSNNGAAVNFMMKYLKFGFGETTEQGSYDVRAGRLTREEGAALAKRLDGKCHPKLIDDFCQWIGISADEFWQVAEKYRGDMWYQNNRQEWQLKNPVWKDYPKIDAIDTDVLLERVDTRKHAENTQTEKKRAAS